MSFINTMRKNRLRQFKYAIRKKKSGTVRTIIEIMLKEEELRKYRTRSI